MANKRLITSKIATKKTTPVKKQPVAAVSQSVKKSVASAIASKLQPKKGGNNKKSNKNQQEEEDEEIDENELKRQLQDMISNSGNYEDEEDDFDSEDDNQDVMDFDDSDEEIDEDDEEMEDDEGYGNDLNEDDNQIDEVDDEENQEDEEDEDDGIVDDLFNEMNSGDENDEEEEEEEEEEIVAPKPTKKLSKKIEMSGNAFQGFASVADIIKQESAKPKKAPEMIRELNSDEEEVQEQLDDSENEMDKQERLEQELKQQQQKSINNKYIVNDVEGMKDKLRDFRLGTGKIPWIHTLAVTAQQPLDLDDVHDDFKREIAFYKQTLQSVTECEKLCAKNGLTVRRMPDFFAEMIKSDEQMHKIKANIQADKKRVETAEMIRKKREIKKFGKQVQTQKLQERQKQKTDAIESVKKWRKSREKGNVSDEFNIDLVNEDSGKKDKKKVEKTQLAQKGDKRKKKDAKYGFGGKKRYAKTNDAKSVNDISSFSAKRNNEDRDYSRGKGGKMNKGGKGGSRGAGSRGAPKGGNSRASKPSRPGKSKRGNGRK